jgi:hypothetical protein
MNLSSGRSGSKEAGFDGHLDKPVETAAVEEWLSTVASRA